MLKSYRACNSPTCRDADNVGDLRFLWKDPIQKPLLTSITFGFWCVSSVVILSLEYSID